MIEQITNMLADAELSNATITLRRETNGNVTVVILPTIGEYKSADANAHRLREMLSQPIIVQSQIAEIDKEVARNLSFYANSFTPAMTQFNSITETVKALDNATENAAKKASKTSKAKTQSATENKTTDTDKQADVSPPVNEAPTLDIEDMDSL